MKLLIRLIQQCSSYLYILKSKPTKKYTLAQIEKSKPFSICKKIGLTMALASLMLYSFPQTTIVSSNFEPFVDTTHWYFVGGSINYWTISTAVNNGGTRSAYVTNDLGVSNAYTASSSNYAHIYHHVQFPFGETAVMLSFDWKGMGAPNAYMTISLSNTIPSSSGLPSGASNIPITFYGQEEFTRAYIPVPASLAAGSKYLIFSWVNSNTVANPPTVIDNIKLTSAIPAPISGLKTIGAGNEFVSPGEAIANLNLHGVGAGGVTFNVPAGSSFNENLLAITASGSNSNPVIFQKSGGGPNPISISRGAAHESYVPTAVVNIIGGDYFTFDGIDIKSISYNGTHSFVSGGFGFKDRSSTNGAQNNTVKNTNINLFTPPSFSFSTTGILQTHEFPPSSKAGANSENRFLNFSIKNATSGIALTAHVNFSGSSSDFLDSLCEIGTTDPSLTNLIGNVIITNNIVGFGIYAQALNSLKIFNTKIENITTNNFGVGGISVNGSYQQLDIYNNEIKNLISNSNQNGGFVSGITALGNSITRIFENRISNLWAGRAQCFGISASTTGGECQIYKNRIFALQGTRRTVGISTHNSDPNVPRNANTTKIYNNFIGDLFGSPGVGGSRTVIGIYFKNNPGGGDQYLYEIEHNTVRIDNSSTLATTTCIEAISGPGTRFVCRNNIFANYTSNPNKQFVSVSYFALANLARNNNMFIVNPASYLDVIHFGARRTNSNNFIELLPQGIDLFGGEQYHTNDGYTIDAPLFINPPFVSTTDLHLVPGAAGLESRGIPSGVLTDIDNDGRPGPAGSVNGGGTASDIGADEYDGLALSNVDLANLVLSYGLTLDNNFNHVLLSSTDIGLAPLFAPTTINYSASVPNIVNRVVIRAIVAHASSTVTINGNSILSIGNNIFTIVVRAQDGTTKTYTINVERAAQASDNSNLSNLSVGQIKGIAVVPATISPSFAASTTNYTASVPNNVTQVLITPTFEHAAATGSFGFILFNSLDPSRIVNLAVGDNVIPIIVSAENGTTKTYTITINRAAAQSSNSNLSNLTTNSGTLSPVFVSSTTGYMASVANTVSEVMITPTAEHVAATVTVNGFPVSIFQPSFNVELSLGNNIITIVVTAENATTKTYTLNVNRSALVSTNANLSNLVISQGTLTPVFATATINYTASVGNSISSLTVTPTAEDANSTITVNGTAIASGSTSAPIALSVGANNISFVVTAQDGVTVKTYSIEIIRVPNPIDSISVIATWINGDTTINRPGIYGIKGQPDAANKPGSRTGALTWKDAAGNLWLFGGQGYASSASGALNDLWKYEPVTNLWTWINGDSISNQYGIYNQGLFNKPGSREHGVSWQDTNGNFWMFGGRGFADNAFFLNSGNLNDLWKYILPSATTGETGIWQWVGGSNQASQPGIYSNDGIFPDTPLIPGSRQYATSWTDNSGNFWLFGGHGYGSGRFGIGPGFQLNGGWLNDLWYFNVAGGVWQWMGGNDSASYYNTKDMVGRYGAKGVADFLNTPPMMSQAISWTDASNNLWMFGGTGHDYQFRLGPLNALWKFSPGINGISGKWTWMHGDSIVQAPGLYGTKGITSITNTPGSRVYPSNWKDKEGNFWLFGGTGIGAHSLSSGSLNDLWQFNPATNKWAWVAGDKNTSGDQVNPNRYGIYGTKGVPNIANKPGERYSGASWTDNGGNLWLYGGYGYGGNNQGQFWLNDLWKYQITSISPNANLSNLVISQGTLSPLFTTNIISYTASVANSISSLTVTPTAEDATSKITVNGNLVASGSPTAPIALSVGANNISVVVTAQDGVTTKTYTVNVTRASSSTTNNLYVNDNTSSGDHFTTSIGNDVTGNGSPAAPYRTINKAMSVAGSGDTIFVDAGSYTEHISITKSLTFCGPNYQISPVNGTRIPEASIRVVPGQSTIFEAHTPSTDIAILGFSLNDEQTPGSPLTDGHFNRDDGQNITILFEKNKINHATSLFAGTLTPWKKVTITDNVFAKTDATPTSTAIFLQDLETGSEPPHAGTMDAIITDNVINSATFAGMILNNLLSATVLRNKVMSTTRSGIAVSGRMGNVTISQNAIDRTNTAAIAGNGGIEINSSNFTGTILVSNNTVTNTNNAFAIRNGNDMAGKDIHVNNNSFNTTNTKAINHGGTGTVDATCNWYGSVIPATIAASVSGPVTFTPFLNNGTDNDLVAPGFQPVPGSCGTSPCGNDIESPVITLKQNITLYLDGSGNANFNSGDIVQSVTDNCAVQSISISPNSFTCANLSSNNAARFQSYTSPITTGNQDWQGELGMEFVVNNSIIIKQLGAFDHQGDGIKGKQGQYQNGVRVAIYNKAAQTIVPGLDELIVGNADFYTGNHRMMNITPVTLMPGTYVLVAKGYNDEEWNGNGLIAGSPAFVMNDGGGAISFIQSWYSDNNPLGFAFPQYPYPASPNIFLAGTFTFEKNVQNNAVTVTATDINGNIAHSTANIVVIDNLAPIILPKANVSVQLDASGNVFITPNTVIESITDNCSVDASSVTVSPTSFTCADILNITSHQAYSASITTGNQAYQGELGMEFKVNDVAGIWIRQLGAFDHQANGISGTKNGGIRVAVYNKATKTIVNGLDEIIVGNSDAFVGNHRMKNIIPVRLMPGNYVLVAKGYNFNEWNRNGIFYSNPTFGLDDGNKTISFIQSWYGDNNVAGFHFPQYSYSPSPNIFLAGTFTYDKGGTGYNRIIITASDIQGNATSMLAHVLVNASAACIPRPVTITQSPVTKTGTDAAGLKIYPNPADKSFNVQLSNLTGSDVTIQIIDQYGKMIEQKKVSLSGKTVSLTIPFNMSDKPQGMYIIKVISKEGITTDKVIIQR